MSDLVERLRAIRRPSKVMLVNPDGPEAAARIEELEARVKVLQGERDDARLLVGRAQIVGGSLPESWHRDARAALNPSARSE